MENLFVKIFLEKKLDGDFFIGVSFFVFGMVKLVVKVLENRFCFYFFGYFYVD